MSIVCKIFVVLMNDSLQDEYESHAKLVYLLSLVPVCVSLVPSVCYRFTYSLITLYNTSDQHPCVWPLKVTKSLFGLSVTGVLDEAHVRRR